MHWSVTAVTFACAATLASCGESADSVEETLTDNRVADADVRVTDAEPFRDADARATEAPDTGGAHATPVLEAGAAPPSQCIPSCVWEILKGCLPGDECVQTEDGLARCEPSTGWYSELVHGGQSGTHLTVYQGETLCYTARWGGASPFNGRVYSSPSLGISVGVAYDWTRYACSLADEFQPLDPTLPECAQWIALVTPSTDCVAGECVPPASLAP